jgi:5'(3')-deoxyribonucleotidase
MIDKKPPIGLDIDGFLNEFQATFLGFHNRVYGTNYGLSDLVSYDSKPFGRESTTTDKHLDFYESNDFKNMALTMFANTLVWKLSRERKVYAITSRPDFLKMETIRQLRPHFLNRFSNVIFTTKDKKKSEVCKSLGIAYIGEDNPQYSVECANQGIEVFLYDRPWNRNLIDTPRITRIFSLLEIPDKINEMENGTRNK